MTICDLCLKENRPLHNYSLGLISEWPGERTIITQNGVQLCTNCVDKIVCKGLFEIIKNDLTLL